MSAQNSADGLAAEDVAAAAAVPAPRSFSGGSGGGGSSSVGGGGGGGASDKGRRDEEAAAHEGDGSGNIIVEMFGENSEEEIKYDYLEQEDPDKRRIEPEFMGSRLLRAVQFVARGQAVPWRSLLVYTLWTVFITGMSRLAASGWDGNNPDECSSRWWCTPIALDSSVATYVGFALFLLLGFQVSDANGRYYEAIRIWNDEIAGTVAAFATYSSLAFPRGLFHTGDRERILGLVAAVAVTLKRELREEKDLRELKSMLAPEDLAAIQAANDMPGHCLYILHQYVMAATQMTLRLPGPFIPMLMNQLLALAGFQGMVMRIKTYQMPYGYAGHLKIFTWIWFSLLPLSLVETTGWFTILWVPMIAYGIIGMQTAARELCNPFGYQFNDIRLGAMTAAIQADVRKIYRKSLKKNFGPPKTPIPDMLNVPKSQGGDLPDS